jgi:hypothetical protein
MQLRRPALVRLGISTTLAVALVAGTVVVTDSAPFGGADADGRGEGGDYRRSATQTAERAAAGELAAEVEALLHGNHVHEPGTTPHDDADPETKNAISRAAQTTDPATTDPTTPGQAAASKRAVAQQRSQSEPSLRTVPVDPPQPTVPSDRYNLFNSCYGLQSVPTRRWLADESAPHVRAGTKAGSLALYFKPTDLGRYLLHTSSGRYLSATRSKPTTIARPGPKADWTVTMPTPGKFRLHLAGAGYLTAAADGTATISATATDRTLFTPYRRGGCAAFPEVEVNVTGDPAAGATAYQETRGFIDAHTHGMAFEFLGGQVHCGRPWSPWGVTVALRDCPDHLLTGGYGAVVESFMSGQTSHDPVGWPTFRDWPAPRSLTHEGTYYKWMERAWRGGQRILVNLLVENNQLCMLYPLKRNSCDDMDSIRLQARQMRAFERYVDAQHGGPGKGWYRIVEHPDQARRVVNGGKLAVVMGIETSVLFNCHQRLGLPSCTRDSIRRQLDEVQDLGVVQMELVNKFDNALAGVAGDEGTTGSWSTPPTLSRRCRRGGCAPASRTSRACTTRTRATRSRSGDRCLTRTRSSVPC